MSIKQTYWCPRCGCAYERSKKDFPKREDGLHQFLCDTCYAEYVRETLLTEEVPLIGDDRK